jgi:hypothetical protein
MTIEYQPEHILGAMFELRDNQRIEDRVSKYIEKKGWSYVVELLRKGRALEFVVPGWDIPLRPGVLRDGMIELLQLKEFMGLDVDFVDAFARRGLCRCLCCPLSTSWKCSLKGQERMSN